MSLSSVIKKKTVVSLSSTCYYFYSLFNNFSSFSPPFTSFSPLIYEKYQFVNNNSYKNFSIEMFNLFCSLVYLSYLKNNFITVCCGSFGHEVVVHKDV